MRPTRYFFPVAALTLYGSMLMLSVLRTGTDTSRADTTAIVVTPATPHSCHAENVYIGDGLMRGSGRCQNDRTRMHQP